MKKRLPRLQSKGVWVALPGLLVVFVAAAVNGCANCQQNPFSPSAKPETVDWWLQSYQGLIFDGFYRLGTHECRYPE